MYSARFISLIKVYIPTIRDQHQSYISDGSRGGLWGSGSPPYHPDQTEAQRDEKKNLETAFPPPPPYQGLDDRLSPTLLSQGLDPALYIFNFEGQIMANILLVLREQLYMRNITSDYVSEQSQRVCG